MTLQHKLIRLYRYLSGACVVCGRRCGVRYCSLTCMMVDGVCTTKENLREPRLFEGTVQNYKNFEEKYL